LVSWGKAREILGIVEAPGLPCLSVTEQKWNFS